MKEYIERESAVKVCSNQYKECLRKSDWCGDTVAWNICYGIKAIPAADVVERKRGEWANGICTACNFDLRCLTDGENDLEQWVWDEGFDFCPNCGADMREVDHA